jgi:hypothetical protein
MIFALFGWHRPCKGRGTIKKFNSAIKNVYSVTIPGTGDKFCHYIPTNDNFCHPPCVSDFGIYRNCIYGAYEAFYMGVFITNIAIWVFCRVILGVFGSLYPTGAKTALQIPLLPLFGIFWR